MELLDINLSLEFLKALQLVSVLIHQAQKLAVQMVHVS
jgi:hypothetical protein